MEKTGSKYVWDIKLNENGELFIGLSKGGGIGDPLEPFSGVEGRKHWMERVEKRMGRDSNISSITFEREILRESVYQ